MNPSLAHKSDQEKVWWLTLKLQCKFANWIFYSWLFILLWNVVFRLTATFLSFYQTKKKKMPTFLLPFVQDNYGSSIYVSNTFLQRPTNLTVQVNELTSINILVLFFQIWYSVLYSGSSICINQHKTYTEAVRFNSVCILPGSLNIIYNFPVELETK